jgi:hypothetical protein
MSQEIVTGKIVDWEHGGTVLIRAPLPRIETAIDRRYSDVQVGYNDGRHISPEQRRKAYVLMSQVAEYIHGVRNADTLEDTKEFLKADFVFNHMQAMQRRLFSLSTVSMNTASDFIHILLCRRFAVKRTQSLLTDLRILTELLHIIFLNDIAKISHVTTSCPAGTKNLC